VNVAEDFPCCETTEHSWRAFSLVQIFAWNLESDWRATGNFRFKPDRILWKKPDAARYVSTVNPFFPLIKHSTGLIIRGWELSFGDRLISISGTAGIHPWE
jgi:hypothetical protein